VGVFRAPRACLDSSSSKKRRSVCLGLIPTRFFLNGGASGLTKVVRVTRRVRAWERNTESFRCVFVFFFSVTWTANVNTDS